MSTAKGNGQDATTIEMVQLLRALRDDVHAMRDDLVRRIDHVESSLGARIDRVEGSLGARIDNVESSLGARIDRVEAALDVVRGDVLAIRADQATMRAELNSLRSELRADLSRHENERREEMRAVVERVERLEAAVFKKTG